jgi:PAS domain S-box-containing protein
VTEQDPPVEDLVVSEALIEQAGPVFQSLFERSTDAIWLFDPELRRFLDCNQAAIELMAASNKEHLLQATPEDLGAPFQFDGTPTFEKTAQIIAYVAKHKRHRFEWLGHRLDGREVPLEVSATAIDLAGRALFVIMARDISERKQAEADLRESERKFREVFEATTDAVSIFDPLTRRNIACNEATVKLLGGPDKGWFLSQPVESLSPERQPDGRLSKDVGAVWVQRAVSEGPQRFEWIAKRINGEEIPVEILLTPMRLSGRLFLVTVSRDISERKRAEQALLELNQSLERRVAERTAALTTSEARFRAMVEHAPEAIVVYSVETGRFLFGNQHACDLYGVTMEKLAQLTPVDVSPEFQADGRTSAEHAQEKIREVLDGGISVFEWIHKKPDGRLIPTEVRLLRLPAEGQKLIRASIIDNTERKRAERALRDSEAKFRALFEGSSQGVVLHDGNQLLEANPAAVRIMRRDRVEELLGKHPGELAPAFQPNGEISDVVARRHIEECMAKGSARFEWVAATPNGEEIPLEVALTRIEWSGREVIQAFITDITERRRAQAALAESEARFSAAFQAGPILTGISRMSDGAFILVNDALLNWSGYARDEVIGRNSAELGFWERSEDRAAFWEDLRRTGSVRERECRVRNRHGKAFTLLMSSKVVELNGVPHLLSMALDITRRKEAEAEVLASEARLRESEARFSVAFHASPALIGILRMNDGKYVLANDAHLNWLGYSREEVIGRTCLELGVWEDTAERDRLIKDIHALGSVGQRECVWLNRHGQRFTVLISAETIQLSDEPHVLLMVLDISQRKRAEEELRASEARLRESETRFNVAFQASPVFINILSVTDRRYVWANDAFVNRLGYSREEVLGSTSAEFGMWENPVERDQAWLDMQSLGSIRQREVRWLNRHGEPLTVLLSAEIIKFNDAPHILSLALDITQRKRAEIELLKALEREKELSQLKSNFVSMVSHEFRTPLGIIQSSAELLRDFFQRLQPPERDEQLESITRNTRRMAGMMEEILVLSRLDAGGLDFQPAPIDLRRFCRRIIDEVESALSRRCAVQLSLGSIPAEAKLDERLLGHIFTNLLSNAVKYSEPDAMVDFTIERAGDHAVCVVRDRGIGIPQEDQQQLFKAFHRGSNVGSRPGTGLGLVLVKRCAELHGGEVAVESQPGKGTTVTVKIPLFSNTL